MATLRIHGSKPHTYKKFPLQKKYPALHGGDFLFLRFFARNPKSGGLEDEAADLNFLFCHNVAPPEA
jgi:hypothetical protein